MNYILPYILTPMVFYFLCTYLTLYYVHQVVFSDY